MSETPDRLESVFAAAVALPDADERATYLEQACAGDAALRGQVEALLKAHARAGHLLDRPVPGAPELTGPYLPGPQPGTVIAGRYKLLEQIGEGGMGTVWVAEQTQPVRRKVALKLIKAGLDSSAVLARFEAERQALAVMDHPHIAKVLDGGATDTGRPFFVMEYVKGVPITQYCDATRLSVPERLQLFVQVCAAVQHAHQKGIIHRDLKPSNILVAPYDDKPVPKVIDFGLAKAMHQALTERTLHTAHETVLGTPLYMSPEQAQLNNLDVDTRADIYSLGVLLYELLTGTTPLEKKRFKEAAWEEVRRLIREEEPPRPSARLSSTDTLPALAANRQTEPARLTRLVRGELDWIVMKALEKDRSRRYETANAFALDVQRYLAGEPVLAAPPGVRYRLGKLLRKHRTALVTAAALVLLLVAGVAVSTWQAVLATQAEGVARRAEQQALQAQQAEAQRAASERLANRNAQAQKAEAERAATAERLANEQAQKRLQQIEKANAILTSIFRDLNPRLEAKGDLPLQAQLGQRLDKAAELLEGEAVGDPVAVARLQLTLGNAHLSLGYAGRAIALFTKARQVLEAKLGAGHPDTLTSMDNLAQAYLADGQLQKALPLFEQTLAKRTAQLGADHPVTLAGMNNLAGAYLADGQLKKAIPLFEDTLARLTAQLGTDHPDTLASMNNLAAAYQADRQLKKALPLFEDTLAKRTAKLGADHPDTLTSMNYLALAYLADGQLKKALPLLEDTLAKRTVKLGADHPDTLHSMNHLAAAYYVAKQLDQSIALFEETLKRQQAKLGRDHPHTLMTMANLGFTYRDVGRLQEALPLLEEAYRAAKIFPKLRHVGVHLLLIYAKVGETAKFANLLPEQLAEARQALPKDSPQLAALLAQFGLALLEQKKGAEAEALLRECLAIRRKTQPEAWTTFHTQAMLGAALLEQKKYTEAEPLLLAGYEGMKMHEAQIPSQGKARLTEAALHLVQLYEATGNQDEAAKWRKVLRGR
jgi:hypothetical protein